MRSLPANNRAAMGAGLLLSLTTLASFSCALAANALYVVPPAVSAAIPLGVFVLAGSALSARTGLSDVWRAFDTNTKVTVVVFVGAYFSVASWSFGRWNPLIGLLALHLPAVLTCISERAFARLYLLAGLTGAFALSGSDPYAGFGLLTLLFFLVCITAAYDNFYFALEEVPGATGVTAWAPLLLAVGRSLMVLPAVAVLLWISPRPVVPVALTPPVAADNPAPPLTEEEFTGRIFEAIIYTAIMMVLILGLIALLRYLRNKFRRQQGEVLPESIGVPVGSRIRGTTIQDDEASEAGDSPLAQVVRAYRRVTSPPPGSTSKGRGRHQTPLEYLAAYRDSGRAAKEEFAELTCQFERARYTSEPLVEEAAVDFTQLAERIIAARSTTPTPPEGTSTEPAS